MDSLFYSPGMSKLDDPYTPNQAVARNLARARREKGWTQERAAEELSKYIGSRWSKTVWSNAERSGDGDTPRQFTADDLVAFARCFDLPVLAFLLPDDYSGSGGISTPDHPEGLAPSAYVEAVIGDVSRLYQRLHSVLGWQSSATLTDTQKQLQEHAKQIETVVMQRVFGDLHYWRRRMSYLAAMFGRVEQGIWGRHLQADDDGMPAIPGVDEEGFLDEEYRADVAAGRLPTVSSAEVEPDETDERIAGYFDEDMDPAFVAQIVLNRYQCSAKEQVEGALRAEAEGEDQVTDQADDYRAWRREMEERSLAAELATALDLPWDAEQQKWSWKLKREIMAEQQEAGPPQ